MAIKKDIPTPYGVNCTYWVIRNINIEPINRCASFTVNGYVTADDFKAGRTALDSKQYSLDGEAYDTLAQANGVVAFLYEWMLKSCPDFCDGG